MRESGLNEVEDRLQTLYTSAGIVKFIRSPLQSLTAEDLKAVIMFEGEDIIVNRSTRDFLGYPCRRDMKVIVQVWDFVSGDVKALCNAAKVVVLANKGTLGNGTIIRENKITGPISSDIPDVYGMAIEFSMVYTDSGPF